MGLSASLHSPSSFKRAQRSMYLTLLACAETAIDDNDRGSYRRRILLLWCSTTGHIFLAGSTDIFS